MDFIQTIIKFAQEHGTELLAAWGALVAFATVVVKLTPTTKDDDLLAKVVKFFDNFSVVNPKK
jgi:hypothetical protein